MRIFAALGIAAALASVLSTPAAAQAPTRMSLADALTRAAATSHRLAELRARGEGADAAVRGRQAADAPTLTASASYMRTNHVDEFGVPQPDGRLRVIFPDIPDNALTRLSLQWPIYTGGRTGALERAAAAEARAIGAELEAARADLRLEVVRAYWALVTAAESATVLERSLSRAEAHVEDMRSREAAGLVPPNEVLAADAQRARQAMLLIEARNRREAALVDLRRLTGLGAGEPVELTEGLDAPVSDQAAIAPLQLDRRVLVERVDGADARVEAAAAGTRPTVAVTGSVDYANPNPRIFPRQADWQESWDVAVTVSWPLWDGGRADAERAEAAALATAARARLAELDAVLDAEIRRRRLDLDSSRAAVEAARAGVGSAREARRVVSERFAAGVATSTDILDADVALLQAELDLTRALANVRLADARLARLVER